MNKGNVQGYCLYYWERYLYSEFNGFMDTYGCDCGYDGLRKPAWMGREIAPEYHLPDTYLPTSQTRILHKCLKHKWLQSNANRLASNPTLSAILLHPPRFPHK
jgi:hypothetical protein